MELGIKLAQLGMSKINAEGELSLNQLGVSEFVWVGLIRTSTGLHKKVARW